MQMFGKRHILCCPTTSKTYRIPPIRTEEMDTASPAGQRPWSNAARRALSCNKISTLSFRRTRVLVLTGVAILGMITLYSRLLRDSGLVKMVPNNPSSSETKFFVISLANRIDRHTKMEDLRRTLGLEWDYVTATGVSDPIVNKILARVHVARNGLISVAQDPETAFHWPDDIDMLSRSHQPVDIWGSTFWAGSLLPNTSYRPMACAEHNSAIPAFASDLPQHKLLTPARVACWHSHLQLIARIADMPAGPGEAAAIVLEDDIDMERDIHVRLKNLLQVLPTDWHILFLGHCWSNESHHPPLPLGPARGHLHPSHAPKCTHGYALSRIGARRLLLHLLHPPFAYSRAIDQAFAWLVESGRLNSYSIVPSIIVQRKAEQSDVGLGTGSTWRDHLVDGVFGT
ncbi:hypothetical protein BD779DRAFT_1550532 [Infundibulicybe gibba]|nr:hypothetical protein BD779DRAFT_1550532 [Infundibulicybe gibba]